jgi:hypothetical protein
MSYNLFLDDERQPNAFLNDVRAWVIVRSYNQFVETIRKQGLPNFISFDHDLADEHYVQHTDYQKFKEKTGYECAKWLIEHCMTTNQPLPEWQVHSMNPVGRININMILTAHKNRETEELNE